MSATTLRRALKVAGLLWLALLVDVGLGAGTGWSLFAAVAPLLTVLSIAAALAAFGIFVVRALTVAVERSERRERERGLRDRFDRETGS